ncbi:MAG: phosphotransferase family protein [Proteobacteria bacterium]|nr:phosphotransferase family protein [Pseudomonadota bacterium]
MWGPGGGVSMTEAAQRVTSAAALPDAARLGAYLAGRLPGAGAGLRVEPLGGGQSNPTFLLSAGERRYALRTKPGRAADLLPSAHQIEREYRVLGALAGSGVPVPGVHVLCDDEDVIGRAFYVMDFVDGRVFQDPRLPELAPAERAALFADMNRVLARLHGLDYAALGLGDYGKPGDYLARQIARWSRQYRASETEPIESMDRLIEWLPTCLPPGEEATLVHGDFRLDNLVIDAHEPRVVGVLDWELSTLGSPLADFSYHCCVYHFPPGRHRGLGGLDVAALGLPTEAEYVAAYCRNTGRAAIGHWDYYLAYNFFRMAAIVQGIRKRAELGTAAAANALEFGRGARLLAEMGWERARRAGAA